MARPRCVYCGTDLPAAAVEAAAAAREALEASAGPGALPGVSAALSGAPAAVPAIAAPEVERALVVVDLRGAPPDQVSRALGVSTYEATQWSRRGGHHLHRIVPLAESARHAETLASGGLSVVVVPEADVRAAAPLFALGGGPVADRLVLRTEEGQREISSGEVLLVVKGPIAREYPPSGDVRRPRATHLDPGYRYHLHRRSDMRPVELDPFEFAFGAAAGVTSSILEIASWLERLFPGAPVDDAFRAITPAVAPAPPGTTRGVEALAREASASRSARVMLDNVAQFRFYSAWRAAVERRG
jgi:hypothetical protein